MVYTGCTGHEIGIYDHVNQRLLFVNKATGEYSGFCQLPASAPQRTTFGVSYANNLFWLFNNGTWSGYQVVNLNTAIDQELAAGIRLLPNPAERAIQIEINDTRLPENIDLLNLQGQVLLHRDIHSLSDLEIDIQHLPAGTYLARIAWGDALVMKKFIKQ